MWVMTNFAEGYAASSTVRSTIQTVARTMNKNRVSNFDSAKTTSVDALSRYQVEIEKSGGKGESNVYEVTF